MSGQTIFHLFKRRLHAPSFLAQNNFTRVVGIGHNAWPFVAADVLEHYGARDYPPITFIYPSFWLDKLHSDYRGEDWGQTVYGLPPTVRKKFLAEMPDYPEDKLITWGEFQDLRSIIIKRLRGHPKIEMYAGEPESITEAPDGQWEIKIGGQVLTVPQRSFFYNWFRRPRLADGIANPHTMLYTMPRSKVPNPIIVTGHGASLIWLVKHFPNHTIINFSHANSIAPQFPINKDVDLGRAISSRRLQVYTDDKYKVVTEADGVRGNIVDLAGNVKVFATSIPIFAAIGLAPNHDVCASIPTGQKILIPMYDAEGVLIVPTDDDTKRLQADRFIAPKNLPRGSLPHTYTELTELMKFSKDMARFAHPMCYYRDSQAERIKDLASNHGIVLTLGYFEAIDKAVRSLDHPKNNEGALEMYLEVFKEFKKSCPPTDIELGNFKRCLEEAFMTFKEAGAHKHTRISKPGGL